MAFIAGVYDPLGLSAPLILQGRLILQSLCRDQIDWDSIIDEKVKRMLVRWQANLVAVKEVKLPRCMRPFNFNVIGIQLHHFSDASEFAYGCVSYARMVNENGNVTCMFIFGKARVAPLKSITIPRLELNVATLAVKVHCFLSESLNVNSNDVYFWTDSTTVLRYIYNDKARYKTFVANRLAIIRDFSIKSQWHFVNSEQNPADDASRGIQSTRWLNGLDFFYKEKDSWLNQIILNISKEKPLEIKYLNVFKSECNVSLLFKFFEYYS